MTAALAFVVSSTALLITAHGWRKVVAWFLQFGLPGIGGGLASFVLFVTVVGCADDGLPAPGKAGQVCTQANAADCESHTGGEAGP